MTEPKHRRVSGTNPDLSLVTCHLSLRCTNKIHARGPVGLDGLVIYKWKLLGKGQVVADYTGPNARTFTHKKLR